MTTQPEALRLADRLEGRWALHPEMQEVAAELRRQHEENEGLRRERDEARRTVREAHEAGTRLTAQRDALLKLLKDVLPVAEDTSESLGRFCSDEGWAQEDMDRMDNVDGMLPLIRAAIKAVEGEK